MKAKTEVKELTVRLQGMKTVVQVHNTSVDRKPYVRLLYVKMIERKTGI